MENIFPIYLKNYQNWYIKIIDPFMLMDVKLDIISKKKICRIEVLHNEDLVNDWLKNLRDEKNEDCKEITELEFLQAYYDVRNNNLDKIAGFSTKPIEVKF